MIFFTPFDFVVSVTAIFVVFINLVALIVSSSFLQIMSEWIKMVVDMFVRNLDFFFFP